MSATRTCVACRTPRPRDELLRVVLDPHGAPALDFSQRLPGRGAYLCWQRACLESGDRVGPWRRAFRAEVATVEPGWALDSARRWLDREIARTCGLLRKSGGLKSGAHTVSMAMRAGWVRAALLTSDAGADIVERTTRQCARRGWPVHTLPMDSEAFGRAVGKPARSVAVVGGGRLAEQLERALQRYRGLL